MSQNKFEALGKELGELVSAKNKAYGNSFGNGGEFLKLIYPDGITPDQYADANLLLRIFDKLMRIGNQKDYNGESPYLDIAGYGMLGVLNDREISEQQIKDTYEAHGRPAPGSDEYGKPWPQPTPGIVAPKFPAVKGG